MGRPKTYDRDEIAGKAMDVFWLHGYHGTSTQDLVEHMGVNRFSLYAEFGSKQGLYEAALDLYEAQVVTHHFAPLEAPEAGLPELRRLIGFFASMGLAPGSERGCLLCNAATERAPHDPASRGSVQTYLDRISAAVRRALENARQRCEIRADAAVDEEAQLITATLLGFFVLLRAQVEPGLLHGAGRAALRHLEALAT